MNKRLQTILSACGIDKQLDNCEVNDLRIDSRKLNAGDVFLAVQGQQGHGIEYLTDVVSQGAVAVLTDKAVEAEVDIPVIYVANLTVKLGDVAHQFYGKPSENLKVLAVTGTNGKTSVAWFLMHALNKSGNKAAYIGTLGAGVVGDMEALVNTTPSVVDVHRLMAGFVSQGVSHVCMEISSHALDQGRIDGLVIHQALFTNLSRDHLDYHLSMEKYAEAKFQLFDLFRSVKAILNADDKWTRTWLKQSINTDEVVTYGIEQSADWKAERITSNHQGLNFELNFKGKRLPIDSNLMGLFNVENLLLVAASLHGLGMSLEETSRLLEQLNPVPGRMNVVHLNNNDQAIWVVDYAHTPDALSSVLQSLRNHVTGKLFCIFGCGGNRDKGKRALMGRAAEDYADVVVVTDDNPRFESPQEIVAGILAGMTSKHEVIHLRKQAIKHVAQISQIGDVVLVAGKGHEDYQEIKGERTHFNDAETIKNLFEVAA